MTQAKQYLDAAKKAFDAGDIEAADFFKAKYKEIVAQPEMNVDPTQDMSGGEKFAAGMGKLYSDIGLGAQQIIASEDELPALREEAAQKRASDEALMNTGAGLAGSVAGALPAAFIPGANTLVGATLTGAGLSALNPTVTDDERLSNAMAGGAFGLGGGVVGKGVGAALKPVSSRLGTEGQRLAQIAQTKYGMKLSPAQLTNSKPLKYLESVFADMPLTSGKEQAKRDALQKILNEQTLKTAGMVGEEASPSVIAKGMEDLSSGFKQMIKDKPVTLGEDFIEKLSVLEQQKTPFSSGQIDKAISDALELASQGQISGQTYQTVRSGLGRIANSTTDPEQKMALKSIQKALDDSARSGLSETDQAKWDLLRQQYQASKVLQKSQKPITEDVASGDVVPSRLANALYSTDKAAIMGNANQQNLDELARISKTFMTEPSNSLTAIRTHLQNLLSGAGAPGAGAAAGYALADEGKGAEGALLGLGAGAGLKLGLPVVAQAAYDTDLMAKYLTSGLVSEEVKRAIMQSILRGSIAASPTVTGNK